MIIDRLVAIARIILQSNGFKADMDMLEGLISGCENINDTTLFLESCTVTATAGLFYDEINDVYCIREGGSPATLAHYAAIVGRVDILELLEKYKFDFTYVF